MDGIIVISVSPTYSETSPLAMVLTISLGMPILISRMMLAATADVVEPPSPINPCSNPSPHRLLTIFVAPDTIISNSSARFLFMVEVEAESN